MFEVLSQNDSVLIRVKLGYLNYYFLINTVDVRYINRIHLFYFPCPNDSAKYKCARKKTHKMII